MHAPAPHDRAAQRRTIYMTNYDMERLRKLLRLVKDELRFRADLTALEAELNRAQVVDPAAIPDDVITMNSQVRLIDQETAEESLYTLVFPEDADIARGKISVVAPIGTAMLGHRLGDTFQWQVPDGLVTFQVTEIVYQPEAAGDYHL